MKYYIVVLLMSLGLITQAQTEKKKKKFKQEFELEIEGEYRYFFDDAAFPDQKDHFPALSIQPEYSLSWNRGRESINAIGFLRVDQDDSRTHWDIRELYYQKAKGKWELSIGAKKVYWGVAESNHLVDVINQTDQVETFDGEEKLGQPMVQYSYSTDKYGTFDLFYLPYHRRRTFAGKYGRLRFGEVIDKDDIKYESAAEEFRQDFAFRWSHYFGIMDIGVSHFYGSGREPLFAFKPNGEINSFYPVMNQTGLDLQITHSAFLWKFETIYRDTESQDFFALVGGVEYTFSNIKKKGIDIGVLGEYLYDERGKYALSALQNDVFFGSRIAFNDSHDTSILFGGILDLDKETRIVSVEASRRIRNSVTAEIEGRFFSKVDSEELIFSNFKQDSFLRISISKYL
ncbi:MAG: hypothetical protein JKY48_15425 [Flavobacteriales bacterium]|nr:hypothetical protein [Flavobacteriales bacterium]